MRGTPRAEGLCAEGGTHHSGDNELQDRDLFLADVRTRLLQDQDYAKRYYNAKHHGIQYEVSAWVWLRFHHRAAASLPGAAKGKLGPGYYDSYHIVYKDSMTSQPRKQQQTDSLSG